MQDALTPMMQQISGCGKVFRPYAFAFRLGFLRAVLEDARRLGAA